MNSNRIDQLEQFLAQDPQDAFIRYALALERVSTGELPAAKAHFAHLVAHQPDYVGTYYHYGKLLEKMGEPETAKEIYRTGRTVAERARDMKTRAEIQEALIALTPEEEGEDW